MGNENHANSMHWVKGTVGKTIARQGHVNIPDGLYEEEHGRDGFYGPVSHLYRTHAPTNWKRIEGTLKPRAFDCNRLGVSDHDAITSRTRVLFNEDVAIHVSQPNLTEMPFFFRNADADEIYFAHRGEGTIETDFGPLAFKQGDYVVIPRGTTYRIVCEHTPYFLVIESFSRVHQPDRGLLGMHALYDPAATGVPDPQPSAFKGAQGPDGSTEWEVRVQRQGQCSSIFYGFNPLDVVGWKGNLTAWKLSIHDICPVISHRAHLAPSVHTTLQGSGFVMCSFVPRPLESEPGALKVPFFHRNIDYDEVLFYHDGDFFSRDGIDAGMITFHPQGVHHGPHPKALKKSWDSNNTWTDEIAVMVDTEKPLHMSPRAQETEWADYHLSWREDDSSDPAEDTAKTPATV